MSATIHITTAPPGGAPPDAQAEAAVRAYHQRSKHQLQRYAAGPETLDWDAQPSPWRRHPGAPEHPLPLPRVPLGLPFDALGQPGAVPAAALDRAALGQLTGLALGLAAWKQQGPDRWALRCNPSSGNLHPTEGWLILRGCGGADPLPDGLYHYAPREHLLERRAALAPCADAAPGLWLALSGITWREAWKYGERAFRYGQLDAGHALGALAYAAATLGWRLRLLPEDTATLAARLGLDREADRLPAEAGSHDRPRSGTSPQPGEAADPAAPAFASLSAPPAAPAPARPARTRPPAEAEEPELLLQVLLAPADAPRPAPGTTGPWHGRPNLLDPHPLYRWPVIDTVTAASRAHRPAEDLAASASASASTWASAPASAPAPAPAPALAPVPPSAPTAAAAMAPAGAAAVVATPAAEAADQPTPPHRPATAPGPSPDAAVLIRQRRSAQRFDRRGELPAGFVSALAQALQQTDLAPLAAWPHAPRVHPVLFVHRAADLPPGAWLLPRGPGALARLRAALPGGLDWQPAGDAAPATAAAAAPLWRLSDNPALAGTLRTLCCHQALGSDAHLALALLGEFDTALAEHGPHGYRLLLQEAGLLGQLLYLQAERWGLRGTGIGCYFDDGLHQLLGLPGDATGTGAGTVTRTGASPLQSLYHFTIGHPMNDSRIQTDPPYPITPERLAEWLQVEGYADAHQPGRHGNTPLMHAAWQGNRAVVAALLAAGVARDAANHDGNNALWLACVSGQPALVEQLVAAGVPIDHANLTGATCLMYAASASKPAIVRTLLALGANPALTTQDDFSALDMAASLECLQLLRQARQPAP